jgi:hypothetical protein
MKMYHYLWCIKSKDMKLKTANQLGVKSETVNIIHTINMAGFNLTKGDKLRITRIYFRNGETQLEGYVNDRTNKEEVPDVWTDVEYIK